MADAKKKKKWNELKWNNSIEKGEIHRSYLGCGADKQHISNQIHPKLEVSTTLGYWAIIIIIIFCAVLSSFIREIYTHILIQPNVIQYAIEMCCSLFVEPSLRSDTSSTAKIPIFLDEPNQIENNERTAAETVLHTDLYELINKYTQLHSEVYQDRNYCAHFSFSLSRSVFVSITFVQDLAQEHTEWTIAYTRQLEKKQNETNS